MKKLNIVLVKTLYSRNLGSVARVCANMNAHLILIDRQADRNLEAYEGAAGAQKTLDESEEFSSVESFHLAYPNGIHLAFSRRRNQLRKPLFFQKISKDILIRKELQEKPIFLIFGPENHGLSQEDIQNVHSVVELPVDSFSGSLNLAQAVLLALYIWREKESELKECEDHLINSPVEYKKITNKNHIFPDEIFKTLIETLGYDISTRRYNMYSAVKQMILRSYPTSKEQIMMEKLFHQIVRKIRENKKDDNRNEESIRF